MSTAFADAKITRAVLLRRAMALCTRSSVGMGLISMVGISMTAAPSSTSSRRNGSIWWRARVIRMRRPWSGRFDSVSSRSAISTPGPRTSSASPLRPYVAALRASSPSGALTRCCPGWPGLRISAAGVSGVLPSAISAVMPDFHQPEARRSTTVSAPLTSPKPIDADCPSIVRGMPLITGAASSTMSPGTASKSISARSSFSAMSLPLENA